MRRLVRTTILVSSMMLSLVGLQGIAAESQRPQVVTLQIDGMTCGACVKKVKAALAKVSGVSAVEITVGTKWLFLSDYAEALAVITFDPGQTGVEMLIKAVEGSSNALSAYKARVLKE